MRYTKVDAAFRALASCFLLDRDAHRYQPSYRELCALLKQFPSAHVFCLLSSLVDDQIARKLGRGRTSVV